MDILEDLKDPPQTEEYERHDKAVRDTYSYAADEITRLRDEVVTLKRLLKTICERQLGRPTEYPWPPEVLAALGEGK